MSVAARGRFGGRLFFAGLTAKGKETLTLVDLAAMGRAATEGIMARGGTQQGDKTLLDALIPAIEKIELFRGNGRRIASEHFKRPPKRPPRRSIRPRTGRRSAADSPLWASSKGTVDPGIVAVATVMRAAVQTLEDNEE